MKPNYFVLPNSFISQLPLTCRRFGIDKSYVLRQAGLSEDILHADYRLIPLSQFVILLEQLYRESEALDSIAHFAQQQDISRLFMLKHLLLRCKSMADLLSLLREVMPLIIPGLVVSLNASEHNLRIVIHHHYAPAMQQLSAQMFTISLACHMLQQTVSDPLHIRSLMLPNSHIPESELLVLKHLFKCPIATHTEALVLNFDAKYTQQTIQIPQSWSEQKDHAPINPELWLYRLKEMITVALPSGRVSLPMIAQQLQCHPRALQRQLKAQGLTLQSIINDVRRMHAEHLLLDTHYDMLTISHMVGLKHQSQLSAKAMQWFGVSAQAYRKAKLEQKKAHQKVG
jgi:AraC-like DNA-binding protein